MLTLAANIVHLLLQARPVASKRASVVPRPPAKPATLAAGPRLASDARSAARRAFDEELAAKEAQLEVRPVLPQLRRPGLTPVLSLTHVRLDLAHAKREQRASAGIVCA